MLLHLFKKLSCFWFKFILNHKDLLHVFHFRVLLLCEHRPLNRSLVTIVKTNPKSLIVTGLEFWKCLWAHPRDNPSPSIFVWIAFNFNIACYFHVACCLSCNSLDNVCQNIFWMHYWSNCSMCVGPWPFCQRTCWGAAEASSQSQWLLLLFGEQREQWGEREWRGSRGRKHHRSVTLGNVDNKGRK